MRFLALTLLLLLYGCSPAPEPSPTATPGGTATIQPVGDPTPLGTP